VKQKNNKPLKGGRFKSVQKAKGEQLDIGEEQFNQDSERYITDRDNLLKIIDEDGNE